MEQNKHRLKQVVKDIYALKINIEEIMPEHRRFKSAANDMLKMDQAKNQRAHDDQSYLVPKKVEIEQKLNFLRSKLAERKDNLA